MKPIAAAALFLLGLTPSQERGFHIYLHGKSSAGREIRATLGAGQPFSAAIVPCVNCHGEEGRGRPESNVRPATITPDALARARPAYTRSLLKRAITMGIASGGRRLDAAMPHYELTQADASDLLDYLSILGSTPQPGITEDTIRIGFVGDVPPLPPLVIYGRTVSLVPDRSPDVFLRIDASRDPRESIAFAEREGIPTIVLQADEPVTGRWTFSLTATLADQREALRAYALTLHAEPLLATSCTASGPVVLMTSDVASRCNISSLPPSAQVIIAAPLPPDARPAATRMALSMATTLLAQLGRDVTRTTFVEALERTHALEAPPLPPLTFTRNQHTGTRRAWLMTVDRKGGRVVGTPGWVE